MRSRADTPAPVPASDPVAQVLRFVLHHRWWFVAAWVLIAVLGAVTITTTVARLTYTYGTPGPGYDTNQAIVRTFGVDGNIEPDFAVLTLPPGQGMRTAAGQAIAARTFGAIPKAGISAVADYANTHDTRFLLDGGTSTWALINMPNPDTGPGVGVVDRIPSILRTAAPAGAAVSVTGYAQLLAGHGGSNLDLALELGIGAIGALLVLLFVFGSAIAVVPVVIAVPTILGTFLGILGLTTFTDVNYLIEYLAVFIGLGISIDYSLLVITRWREEREKGASNADAIVLAGARAGRAVLLSGIVVAVGLLSLFILPVSFLHAIGIGAVMVPVVAILATITLLPALLSIAGPALDRHRVHRRSTTVSTAWEQWTGFILKHRVLAAGAGILLLIILALPVFSLRMGEPAVSALAGGGTATTAFKELQRNGLPAAATFPIQVLTDGGPAAVRSIAAVARSTTGVEGVISPDTRSFRRGDAALVTILPRWEGGSPQGKALVTTLRSRLAKTPGGAHVGGDTAAQMDFDSVVDGNFPLVIGVVSLVTFLILARSLRSIVLAAKAVILNVISLGTAFGFMVFFWQQGHGSNILFHTSATGSIRDWTPMLLFAFLFGLSMDYEVFVLSRIREEHDAGHSTDQAVIRGLGRTGRLVTSAAAILAISLVSLSLAPNVLVATLASSLAIGILLDALVIRTFVLPALVSLMGHLNWWMPAPMARLLAIPATRFDNDNAPPREAPNS